MSKLLTVRANGLEFAYHELGEGPLVLCLHGFPDTADTWLYDIAPAIVRRAERACVALAAEEQVSDAALAYLNRLSDHLFVAARWIAAAEGGDVLWQPGATRNN